MPFERKITLCIGLIIVVAATIAFARSFLGGDEESIPVVDIRLVGFTNRQDRIDGAFLMLSNASSLNLVRGASYTVDSSIKDVSVSTKSFLLSPPSAVLAPGQVEIVETMCPEPGDKWVVTFGFKEEIGLPKKVFQYLRGILGRNSSDERPLFVYASPPISLPSNE